MNVVSVVPDELKEYEVAHDQDSTINFVVSYNEFPEEEVLEQKKLRCRVLTKKNSLGEIIEVRLEFTKYEDISFVLETQISISDYNDIKQKYGLKIDFEAFIKAIGTFISQALSDPEKLKIYLYDVESDKPKLTVFQTLQIRVVEVFSVLLSKPSQDYMMRLAQCRFNAINKELKEKSDDLKSALNKLDAKNPSLCRTVRDKIEKVE